MSSAIPTNEARFTIEEVVRVTGGVQLRGGQTRVVGIRTDTREDLSHSAFVALCGERYDAHQFLAQAEHGGASLLLVERGKADAFLSQSEGTASVVAVDDTVRALGQLAARHRSQWKGRLVAIAGSAGKTTTRVVVQALLEGLRPGRVHATRGNFNNRIGVPMTLLALEDSHECGVVEIGTNQPGEVAELAHMSAPDLALLTLIDLEHTEGLGDLNGVEREEGALFEGLREGGTAIGNGDDERVAACVKRAVAKRRVTYGFGVKNDVFIENRSLDGPYRTAVELRLADRSLHVSTELLGPAGSLAVAAGVLVSEELFPKELDEASARAALAGVRSQGRSNVVALADNRWVVDDSYNSNPGSVKSSIACSKELAEWSGGRLYLVLGEMLELGKLSAREHESMGLLAARSGAEAAAFVCGDAEKSAEMAKIHGLEAEFFDRPRSVVPWLGPRLRPGDVVLVKGSRGVRAEVVVEGLRDFWGGAQNAP